MHYVIADIHGCRKQFLELLEKIKFSENDTLYILGDVLDRGFDPIGTLQDLMSYDNIVFILGNHDYAFYCWVEKLGLELLNFQDEDDRWDFNSWLKDGGLPTMDSFLELADKDKYKIIDYLKNASTYEEIGCNGKKYILVHAGIAGFQENKLLHDYSCSDFVYSSTDYRKRYFSDENTILVTGHMPTPNIRTDRKPEVYFGNGHIGMDCGCVFGGKLAAYCFETEEVIYVEGAYV